MPGTPCHTRVHRCTELRSCLQVISGEFKLLVPAIELPAVVDKLLTAFLVQSGEPWIYRTWWFAIRFRLEGNRTNHRPRFISHGIPGPAGTLKSLPIGSAGR